MSMKRRYPTDLTSRQWRLVEPLLPEPPPGPAGRPPKHEKREVVNAILYHVRAGGSWRMLPKDLPPWETVYGYFARWRDDGTLDRLHDALREQVRSKRERRNPSPSAGIVDSQTVKGADTVGSATRGYDAGKKLNGRQRHIVVDTIGLLLVVMVSAACVQDRDGGSGILKLLHGSFASLSLVYADGGYQGRLVALAKSAWGIVLEIVRKPADQRGFAVLPRRWVVERTFSWLLRWRHLVRDYERLPASHEAMLK
jgi:transposase